jgi:steroid delta-isomerase-like uncharacterized protein
MEVQMALTLSDVAKKRETLVRAHVDAENRHDVEATVATFRQPKYEVMPLGAVLSGAEPVRGFLSGVFEGFPDFAVHVSPLIHAEAAVIAEGRFTGTHKHDWSGIPATGRAVDVPFCALFIFEEDRLMSERLYFDFATLLRQLGVLS